MTVITVQCDMLKECRNSVTHIGAKGYVYCSACAPSRRGVERTRKMAAWELELIHAGQALPSYERTRKPTKPLSAENEI